MTLLAVLIAAVFVVLTLIAGGAPDPMVPATSLAVARLDIGVLVFREGLECILVLAALTANMTGPRGVFQRPVFLGAGIAAAAALVTWRVAVGVLDSLSASVSALHLQAATGLLAVIVLLVVMNWFFHKVYWTGWISLHTSRRQELLRVAGEDRRFAFRLWWGFALLGFTSLYREGFEIVLFLQSYRLKLGCTAVNYGVALGLTLTGLVAALTFIAHRRLPFRRMLVLTGVLLGGVLLVMVGEQAQEMQLAHWLPTTPIDSLTPIIPPWMGLWFAVFPTVQTLVAQILAAFIVVGSYVVAGRTVRKAAAPTLSGSEVAQKVDVIPA